MELFFKKYVKQMSKPFFSCQRLTDVEKFYENGFF